MLIRVSPSARFAFALEEESLADEYRPGRFPHEQKNVVTQQRMVRIRCPHRCVAGESFFMDANIVLAKSLALRR